VAVRRADALLPRHAAGQISADGVVEIVCTPAELRAHLQTRTWNANGKDRG
jgi:hypothetical protein